MMKLKKWIALTTCAAFLAATPLAGASADGRRGGHGGGWGGSSGGYYGGHGGSGFYGGSHNRSRSYYRGHRGYYGRHDGWRGYGRHRGRTGRTVAIGILGLGLGYMLSEASRPRYSQPRTVVYRQPVYRHPAPVYRRPAYRQPVRPAATQCLQEREYQTRVIVGGEEVDAYGTACLQPDGSWRQGPATVVPEF